LVRTIPRNDASVESGLPNAAIRPTAQGNKVSRIVR
jgi:hypothetical protein